MRKVAGMVTLHVVTQVGQYRDQRDQQIVTPHAFRADLIHEVTPLIHANEHAAKLYGEAHAVVHLADSAYWVTETLDQVTFNINILARSQ